MRATSIQIPFRTTSGLSRAKRRITLAVQKKQNLAVMIVCVRDAELLYAALGHEQASEVLEAFHEQLRGIARKDDAIERIGERKFAVLLCGLRNAGHVSLAAQKIQRLAHETVSIHVDRVDLKITIGVVLCPTQGKDADELMRLAEIATLDARHNSEGVRFYETQSAKQLFTNWNLDGRLAEAIKGGDLELHFQPKVCLRSNEVVGAEALMRWDEPEIGWISPEVFIHLAEATGQIVDLTHFAIQRACRQLSQWAETLPWLQMSVNVTPSIIQNLEIIDVLQSASGIWDTELDKLTLEVTENALMADPETSHEVLTRIRDVGCRVSIDDFGTGYSSFVYLKKIPADELKIDRSFVMGMLSDPGDHKIVEHTIRIAESFGLSVVAEGVENQQTLDELRKLGCHFVQGYFISRPISASDFETIYRDSPAYLKAAEATS